MFRSPLFRRLFLPYLLLVCAAVALVGIFAAMRLRATYLERTRTALSEESRLVAQLTTDDLSRRRFDDINRRVKALGSEAESRVTIVNSQGVVIADSDAEAPEMDNHSHRPEILAAAGGGEGFSIRHSDTLHQDLFYFARRIEVPSSGASSGGVYFIRLARRLSDLDASLRQLYETIFIAGLLAVVLAGGLCYVVARRHATPLVELTGFANALATGELNRRLLSPGDGEIGTLGRSLNTMADSLSRLLTQTRQDKAELLTILSSMNEGVIATDLEQRILLVNQAAARLLGFDAADAPGKRLWEVVRHAPILQNAGQVIENRRMCTFPAGPIAGRHLEITLCTFPASVAAEGKIPAAPSSLDESEAEDQSSVAGRAERTIPQGLILVAHDTTQSVQYQELRKEFVANVSHELRTPLSIIKGFSETLRDGALADANKGPKYLTIIENHADQLTNLVDDLLELSKLESQGGRGRHTAVDIGALIRKVKDVLLPVAQRKQQVMSMQVEDGLPPVVGDADYIERAVANLVDNAIKYTPEQGRIAIAAHVESAPAAQNGEDHPAASVVIEVSDTGIGIPEEDLPRIFERFYRVDRSRSREMGGTGLGLSIVKHVVQSHGGRIEASSTFGQGSKFRLYFPVRN